MHVQVLASGSGGNATLLRAGDLHVLVDAGLTPRGMRERLEAARLPYRGLDHILVTHGHLDHARSCGVLGKRHDATVHCAERIMKNRALIRARRLHALKIGERRPLDGASGEELSYLPVLLPHDCDPTVAFRIDHGERTFVVLTDMGHPREDVARALGRDAHVLLLEFNYDADMLRNGEYKETLKRRVGGDRGHLSNAQAAQMLEWLAGPNLHTLILAHLSQHNNTPDLAVQAARAALERSGRADAVEILVAQQDHLGPNLKV